LQCAEGNGLISDRAELSELVKLYDWVTLFAELLRKTGRKVGFFMFFDFISPNFYFISISVILKYTSFNQLLII